MTLTTSIQRRSILPITLLRMLASSKRQPRWIEQRVYQAKQRLIDDWHGTRVLSYGLVLFIISSLVTAAFYINHPQTEINPDTPGYLASTENILTHGQFVNAMRMPGFPTFVALVYLLRGKHSLFSVSLVEAALFVMVALEVYLIAWLIFRRSWLALIVGLLVGTNVYLLAFTKPVTVEGISLWLVTTLACMVVIFVQTGRVRDFWVIALLMLATFMTRPEWVYAPVPLFAYLLFLAARRGKLRRLLPHAIAALVLLYGVLGLYIYVNATQNDYTGISFIQNINELGKVMQYQMQNEAPAQYGALTQKINTLLAQNPDATPYTLQEGLAPEISANDWAICGEYAAAVISKHPLEFGLKTIPVLFTSFDLLYAYEQIDPQGHLYTPLRLIQVFSTGIQRSFLLFPFLALVWFGLLFWRRTRRWRSMEMVWAVMLLAIYDLLLTSVGAYDDYMRFHIPFDPLITLMIWGSVLMGLVLCEPYILRGGLSKALSWLWGKIGWSWVALASIVLFALAGWALVVGGLSGLVHPQHWPVVNLVQVHTLWVMCLVAVPLLVTFLAYRASIVSRMADTESSTGSEDGEENRLFAGEREQLQTNEAASP
jgi:4-amino-4-deoxy-L-arabinose transferase-like glycosyltransferase